MFVRLFSTLALACAGVNRRSCSQSPFQVRYARPMRVDVESVRRAHAFLRTEAPPEPWQMDADETFFPLLGEMIAAGLARGNELGDITLSFANVRVKPPAPVRYRKATMSL